MEILGGLRVCVAQMRPEPGNIRANEEAMLRYIASAKSAGADVVVFPELITSGYMLGDRWEYDSLIHDIEETNQTIRIASEGMVVIFGSVVGDYEKIGEDGRMRKYNAALIAQNGTWVSNGKLNGYVPKTNLPKYRIFDDARHFYPSDKLAEELNLFLPTLLSPFQITVRGKTHRLALTICEDLWEDEYHAKISRIYKRQAVDLIIDISASPWTAGKWHAREHMLHARVQDTDLPILYVNKVGLESNGKNLVWFDGESSLTLPNKGIVWRAPQNEEGLFRVDLNDTQYTQVPDRSPVRERYNAIIGAKRAFIPKNKKVVIGLSGGIDSAVSLAATVAALGADRVLTLNMPTKFNSHTTQELAAKCARNFGVEYLPISIQRLVDLRTDLVVEAGLSQPSGLAYENMQARERGGGMQALVAQIVDGYFLCNGNKTEIALNYCTMYGDAAGAAAFLADLWKGQIYELAEYMNTLAGTDLIPKGIIDLRPSAELSADQNVDEGKGDPIFYPYHDKLLEAFTEKRWDPFNVVFSIRKGTLEQDLGCESGTIKRYFKTNAELISDLEKSWINLNKEFKRVQEPPILIASRHAFGFDRRETLAPAYFTRQYDRYKQSVLRETV